MSDWEKKSIWLTLVIGLTITLITYFFKANVASGILLGIMFGMIHHLLLHKYVDSIMTFRKFSTFFFIVYFLGNFGMFAVPFYIGSVYPNFVNVFGAAFGLSLHKILIYAREFISYRKER